MDMSLNSWRIAPTPAGRAGHTEVSVWVELRMRGRPGDFRVQTDHAATSWSVSDSGPSQTALPT